MTAFSLRSLAIFVAGVAAAVWVFLTGRDIGLAIERADLIAAIWRHVGHGVVLTPVLFLYAAWRFRAAFSSPTSLLSRSAAGLASFVIFFLIVTGPIVVWTYGSDLKVFDWFVIGNPIGKTPGFHDVIEAAHVLVAKLSPWIIAFDAAIWFLPRSRASRVPPQ